MEQVPQRMSAGDAARKAGELTREMFGNEAIKNVGLEEIEFDSTRFEWVVTIGFTRPWDANRFGILDSANSKQVRDYKVVRIDANTGELVSLKIRE